MNAGRQRPTAGFTLIEMIAVLAIVATLVMAAVPLQELVVRRTQDQTLRKALRDLRGALDEHRRAVETGLIARGANGSPWPASLQVLVDGVPLVDTGGRTADEAPRLYLLRRLPRDPTAPFDLPAAQTWALRSSSSPPDNPQPGADVFDVSSRSEATALDGTRLRDW